MRNGIKSFIAGMVAGAILFSGVVSADGLKRTIEVLFNYVSIEVNGKKVDVDNILYGGTTYAPIRAVAEMLGKEVSWDQNTMTASINDVVYNVPEMPFYANNNEFYDNNSGDIIVECNKDTVYINSNGEWKWTLYLSSKDGREIELTEIREFFYDYLNNYSPAHVFLASNIKTWAYWGNTTVIGANEKKRIGCGIGNPQDNDLYFYDYYVKGVDEDGKEIKGCCRVSLSKKEASEVFAVESSEYDTQTLRNNAEYRVRVTDGVYWVPANILGKSDLTENDIRNLGSNPETLKENVDTLYEVIQYLQVADFKAGNDNIRIQEGDINWEHHKPGEMAIKTNEGCCATSSNLLNYLLEGDYDEVGFMAHSQSDGNGHVYNYIKQNGKYYVIDLTHYRNDFMNTAVENGNIDEYYSTDFISGNIHEVEDLTDYAVLCRDNFNVPPVLFSAYVAENVLPIDSVRKDNGVYISYPDVYKDKVTIVYDKEEDNVAYDFVSPPRKYPVEWEPYNTKY